MMTMTMMTTTTTTTVTMTTIEVATAATTTTTMAVDDDGDVGGARITLCLEGKTKTVTKSSASRHLRKGASLGPCPEPPSIENGDASRAIAESAAFDFLFPPMIRSLHGVRGGNRDD